MQPGGFLRLTRAPFPVLRLLVVLTAILLAWPASPAGAERRREIPDRLILQVRPGAHEAEVRDEIRKQGGRVVEEENRIGLLVVQLPPGKGGAAKNLLRRSRKFKFVEPDALLEPTLVPNDTHVSNAWHLAVMDLFGAWDYTTGSPAMPIAILDSGVDPAHPDLASKLVAGWNFYDNNANTADVAGHGTLVAGAAAAIGNNGIGVAGPAFANPIMPVRVTNTDGWALQSAIVSGLVWAADNGAKVANLSFGGVHSSSSVTTAAQYFANKGGIVTVSSGNFGTDDGSPDNPYMVSVSATSSADVITSWSSFGSYVDVAAPGSSVWTTSNGGAYAPASGTSFSAPVTAGVLGLIFAANPSLTPGEAEEILEETADDLGVQGYDIQYGWGRVNAGTAVMVAQGGGSPAPDTTPPLATITSPPGGASVSGSVTVAATAVDDTAVTEVRFYADGALTAVDATSPYSALWNTGAVPDGAHTLLAEAYDAAGNRGASQTVAVNVQNAVPDTTAPAVQVMDPADGAVLSGTVTLAASASDDNAIAEVRLYVDGALNWTGDTSPLAVTLDTTRSPDGPHTVHAEATDLSGNVGVSAPVNVQVANATPPPPPPPSGPVVVFTPQANGISVNPKKHIFPVEVTGPNPILYVEFEIDGILQRKRDKSAPYAFKASTKKWAVGTHTVTARAIDALGKTGQATVTVTRVLSEKERLKLEKRRLKEEKKKKKKKNK